MNSPYQKAPKDTYILVVDDLVENALIVKGFLAPQGYNVHAVQCGEDALAYIGRQAVDLVLLDLMMPGMDGYEVCTRLKSSPATRHIPIIIVTGLSDRDANVRAVESGADDFLIKPFDRVLLQARLKTSLRSKFLQDELLAYQHELEDKVRARTKQLEVAQQVTVFSLAKLAESRDNETGEHIERLRSYAYELALAMQPEAEFKDVISTRFIRDLYESCPLHDIGKVGIPDRILLKPGRLNHLEFDIMKSHTTIGGDTLRLANQEIGTVSFLAMGRDVAYFHHERWDGAGYPTQKKGEEIPLAARIVALADVYDALASRRPYKEPMSHEKSRGIILEGRGTQFDARVVDAFLRCEARFIEVHQQFADDPGLSHTHKLIQRLEEEEREITPS